MPALNPAQVREVEAIAELQCRRYFDHYLTDVFPNQVKALREHTYLMIEKHDDDEDAHGAVEHKLNKLVWVFFGIAAASGGAGALVSKVLSGVG